MKMNSTKSKLISSLLVLTLCVTMFVGSTYAWFTDSVESTGNIIKSGTLDVTMEWADGTKAVPAADSTEWNDASTGAIFNYQLWEPGYTDVKHIQIANVGNLALKYQLQIEMEDGGTVSNLAKVIDVYFIDPAQQIASRTDLAGLTPVGTLDQFITNGTATAGTGDLQPGASNALTIALKMQESAGNEYQGDQVDPIGNFKVKLVATQDTVEADSFDDQYDFGATFDDGAPDALVTPLTGEALTIKARTMDSLGNNGAEMKLDTGYQFKPADTKEEGLASEYADWHADFVVKASDDVAANSIALAGYYEAWCSLINNEWISLTSPDAIPANTEIRLVKEMGRAVSYWEICEYGNDGTGFCCGAKDLGDNAGTTLTVELRLYEATGGALETETGHYITIGEFEYTFE